MKQIKFSFEDLFVWQKAVDFAKIILNAAETLRLKNRHYRLIEQLESASTSIALNIAEGKGRYSKKDFIRFLYVARGSLYETVSLLIILNKNKLLSDNQLIELKNLSYEIGKMICGLINSLKSSIANELAPRNTNL